VHREPDLSADRLRQEDLVGGPVTGLGPVEAEDSDHAIEDQDGDCQHGPRAQIDERLTATEGGIVELGRSHDVRDGERPALPGGEVQDG
jgi:hypothetical protein